MLIRLSNKKVTGDAVTVNYAPFCIMAKSLRSTLAAYRSAIKSRPSCCMAASRSQK